MINAWFRTLTAAFIFVLAFVPAPTAGAAAPGYDLLPRQTLVAPGALCTLSVVVDVPGDSVGCVECRISYDPSLVTLVSAGKGALFTGASGLFFDGAVAPDTHYVEGCLLGYRTYALTPGEVVRFVFRADVPGICPVRIERLNMWDIDRVLFTPNVDPYAWITIGTPTGVVPPLAETLRLAAFPNPFNPATTLVVSGVAVGEPMEVTVYDAGGRRVRWLMRGPAPGGDVRIRWDGRDGAGRRVRSGVYFAVAGDGERKTVRKLVLLQ